MNKKLLNTEQKHIVDWIDSEREQLVEFLQELVAIPSDNPPGDCYEIASFIHKKLKELKFQNPLLLDVDEETVKDSGMVSVSNVVSNNKFGEGIGPEIVLNSHGDVVGPGKGWSYDPYGGTIVDGKLFGRGAAISKSDIVTYTFATMAIREFSERLSGKVSLAFTFDEEIGGLLGPKWLLDNNYISPDIAISAGLTHSIVNAHNGCLHLEVKLKGKSAHAAAPHTGIDALEAMTGVLQSIYDYRTDLNKIHSKVPGIESPTITVGMISGGIHTSVVPDEITIRIDRRLIPEEEGVEVEEEIHRLIEEKVKNYSGIEVEFKRILLAKSFGPTSAESSLVKTMGKNWKTIMDKELIVEGFPIFTDARLFAEANISTVLFGAGPRTFLEANGHRADEHVRIDDMINATKIVALTLYDLLSNNEK